MDTYSMAQMETLTGIKAHTLRIWERRYGFPHPNRTETNIRFYSDEQLKKLLNVSILLNNGYRISKLSQMSDDEVHQKVSSIVTSTDANTQGDIQALILAMLEMDEKAFNKIFNAYVIRKGLMGTVIDLIYPFLMQIGVLWITNKTTPAQEHFISNLIRQKIIAAIDMLPDPDPSAPGIALFLLEGEDHEIGLLLAYFIAKELGWRVYYLGQNVPSENIKDVVRIGNVKLMMTMVVIPTDKLEASVQRVLKETNCPLLLSGNIELVEKLKDYKNLAFVDKPERLVSLLKQS